MAGWQGRLGLDFSVEMDAPRHVVPGIWEPWAVVREDLSSGLNLASDRQVRLPVFSIGIVPPQCTIGGGSGLVVGFGGVLQQDCRTVNSRSILYGCRYSIIRESQVARVESGRDPYYIYARTSTMLGLEIRSSG